MVTDPDFRLPAYAYPERPARLHVDAPTPDTRLIRVRGALDHRDSVRLLRLVDNQLATAAGRATGPGQGTASRGGFRELLVDLTDVGLRGNGPANALAHAAYACGRRGIGFGVVGTPPAGSTPSADGRHRFRTFTSLDAALHALERVGDTPEPARPAES